MPHARSRWSARRLVLQALLTMLLTGQAQAVAQVPQPAPDSSLTASGRLLLGGSLSGYWSDELSQHSFSQWQRWEVQIAPTLTYFVIDDLGVGMTLGGSVQQRERPSWDERAKSFHVGIHALDAVELGTRVQFMPRLSAVWTRSWNELLYEPAPRHFDFTTGLYSDAEQKASLARARYMTHLARVEVFLPIVFSLTQHLGVGLGPMAWVDVFLSREPSPELYAQDAQPGFDSGQRARLQVGASTWIILSL